MSAVNEGVFASLDDFDAYSQAWEDLPNGRYENTFYLPYFKTSDAMIMDCGSFITEYIYLNKPFLYFIKQELDEWNEWGEMAFEHYYQVAPDDYRGIEYFLTHIVDTDPKRAARERFFHEHLDYYTATGSRATENMYHAIADEFDDVCAAR